MNRKLNVGILCGGKSSEHRISLISAQNVIQSLDLNRFNPIIIGIDTGGQWFYYPDGLLLKHAESPSDISLIRSSHKVLLSQNAEERTIYSMTDFKIITTLDVIFPIIHGTYGEDGSIQGLAKIAGIACVGCGILGAAVGMDKDVMKKILRDANIPVAPSVTIKNRTRDDHPYEKVSAELGQTLYIKPANLGSSIGVSRINNEASYIKAIKLGLSYDDKVLVEQTITGREIECAVIGNDTPQASTIGEIIPQNDFYTFENKYVNSDGALLSIPANLPQDILKKAQSMACQAYRALDCKGMTRVDMFYTDERTLLINEVNTIPGFTKISMYPKLWEHEGVSQMELITRLIDLAIEQYQKESAYKHIS